MQLKIVTIRDIKTDTYTIPQFVVSIPGWVRSLTDEINKNDNQNVIAMHPEDFEAWECGTWDDNTGEFITQERHQIIALGNLKR